MLRIRCAIVALTITIACHTALAAPPDERAEASAAEAKAFLRQLAEYVRDHHLKRDAGSPQRGMVYEYYDVTHAGRDDAWIEGEALDTMHDGAWFAVALIHAHRATGDAFYRELLTRWVLPFYVKVLNHSDELFDPSCNAFHGKMPPTGWVKEHLLVEREKGFVPYFWDDGAAVSLEASRRKDGQPSHPACDRLAGRPNPQHRLDGYSLGSSNHLAQDLGVMLMQSWLFLHDSDDPAEKALASEVAEAARNLAASRRRRSGSIPAVMAAVAVFDTEAARQLPEPKRWEPDNHYAQALYAFRPGQRVVFPGFADDDEYVYYVALARDGLVLPRPVAQRLVYDAFTQPMLYRYWSDNAPVPPGMNRFDLYPYEARDGRPADYRSDRPRPAGSRMGPQNMVVSAWALQALAADPGLYDERYRTRFAADHRVDIRDEPDPAHAPRLSLGPATLQLVSTPSALSVSGTTTAETLTLRLHAGPDRSGSAAIVTVDRAARQPAAVNDRGEALELKGRIDSRGSGSAFVFELPYTVVKGQKRWANGIEHGRLSGAVGDATRNLYLVSREDRVKAALRHELAGGIRTWQAIFAEHGYIPTSLGAGGVADRRWDNLSDTGGYAHLISATAQYLLLLQGKTDWQRMRDAHPRP